MIVWLEHLAVVRKVAGSSKWVPDKLQRRLKAAKEEDWAPPFTCGAQDTMGL